MPKIRRIAIAIDVATPFVNHQGVFSGLMRYAREHPNWQCIIDEHPAYRQSQRRHRAGRYDGVIARADSRMQKRLKQLGIPLVSTHYQSHQPGVAGVLLDPAETGRIAAEHLFGRGYRRLSLLVDPRQKHGEVVTEAFEAYAREMQVPCSSTNYEDGEPEDPAFWLKLELSMDRYLSKLEPPMAVLVHSPILARMIVDFCKSYGLHVPQDVAVISLREQKELLEIPTSISSIDLNYEEVGYKAAALLDQLIDGKPIPHRPIMVAPTGIIARTSTDHFAVEDELVAQALRYISANLGELLRVEDIAYKLAVSSRTLQNRFNTALERSVVAEIRRLRISAARVMLADQDVSIDHIATKVGYRNADALGHAFRRELGKSPSAFRKKI